MDTNFDYDSVNGLSNAVCGRVDLLEKMLGLKVRENLRYSDIQKIVKSGFASEFFNLGDEIMTTYTATDGTEYDFPWLVVDFRDVYWENDPAPHPGMVLQAKYATAETIQFDAAEDTLVNSETETTAQEGWYYWGISADNKSTYLNLNTGDAIPFEDYASIHKCGINDGNVRNNGYSNYKMSAVRQWLNSNADVNEWWSPAHFGDVAPESLSTLKGFMAGFSFDFISIIKPTKVQVLADDATGIDAMYDKMFLPSIKELYGVSRLDVKDVEGPYFKYWKEKTGLDSPNSGDNDGRSIMLLNGTVTYSTGCWNRSKCSTNLFISSKHSLKNGRLGNTDGPKEFHHVLPCCVIS